MNILFVGGSNLVLKNGISSLVPLYLKNRNVDVENVYNISVGATSCLFGLENLTFFNKKAIDLVFIEYGINDMPLYVNDRQLWEYAFTNLLALARKKYPSAEIVTILLGRRKERYWKNQDRMHQNMAEISRKYDALVVDIDSVLKNKKKNVDEFQKFYSDESHFKSPNVTQYISSTIVDEYLLNKSFEYFKRNKEQPDGCSELNVYTLPGRVESYENSTFSKKVTVLEKNETIEVRVKGEPTAISFISVLDSCSLLVETRGSKRILNTKRKRAGKFKFVLKQIPLYGASSEFSQGNNYQTVRLTAIDETSKLWDENAVQKTYGMESVSSIDTRVYISHISTF